MTVPSPPQTTDRHDGTAKTAPAALSFLAGFGLGLVAALIVGLGYLGFFIWLVLSVEQSIQVWAIIAVIFIFAGFAPLLVLAGLISSVATGLIVKFARIRRAWLAFGLGLAIMVAVVQASLTLSDVTFEGVQPEPGTEIEKSTQS